MEEVADLGGGYMKRLLMIRSLAALTPATVKVRDPAGNRISQKAKIKVQAPSKA